MAVLTVPITSWEVGEQYTVTVPIPPNFPEGNFEGLLLGNSVDGSTPPYLGGAKFLWTQNELDTYLDGDYYIPEVGFGYVIQNNQAIGYNYINLEDNYLKLLSVTPAYEDWDLENLPVSQDVVFEVINPIPSEGLNLALVVTDNGGNLEPPYLYVETSDVVLISPVSTGVEPVIWPTSRPNGYDPDLWWDEVLGEWVATVAGGGRYRQQLIAIGEDGEIYFGDI